MKSKSVIICLLMVVFIGITNAPAEENQKKETTTINLYDYTTNFINVLLIIC